jgi:hypothetical protein
MKKTFMTKKIPKGVNTDMTLNDLYSALEYAQDPKDRAITEGIKTLFDNKNLYKIARLDFNLAFYIVKHVIIREFYFMYYTNCKYEIKIIQSKTFPFYKIKNKTTIPDSTILRGSYDKLIQRLLEITISFKGEGRKEMIQIIKALREEVEEEKDIKNLIKKFY